MTRQRHRDSEYMLRRLLWGTFILAVVLVALAQYAGESFRSWAWPAFLFVPALFWLLLLALFGRRLLLAQQQRRARREVLTQVIERGCSGVWGEAEFRSILAVAIGPGYIDVSVPAFVLTEIESLIIPLKDVRVIDVQLQGLTTSFRIAYYDPGGHLDELVLYPRRPQRLLAALQRCGAPLNSSGPVPAYALAYLLLDLAWVAFLSVLFIL